MEPVTISGAPDASEGNPWSMQLVFLHDKENPSAEAALCEAAALAVVKLLDDPRAQEEPWKSVLQEWGAGRFRKVVRRAKKSQFLTTHEFPGITIGETGATVRALLPFRANELPKPIKRLQVSGPDLESPYSTSKRDGLEISINPELEMSSGKKAAQAAHAAQMAYQQADGFSRDRWRKAGFPIFVKLHSNYPGEFESHANFDTVKVYDAGLTEIPAGSLTATATLPTWAPRALRQEDDPFF